MSITTTTPPEAELEARITGTLQRIFPGTTDLHAQRRFKLRLGHAAVEGGTRNYVDGRADILVYQGESPLAVLELKREGLALTDGDAEQGASYALLARAPLVVVSNGSDTRLFQTHDMARIEGTSIDASELARRVARAAVAARSSVLGAINKLLGTDLASAAVAAINAAELGELTGEWTSSERFVGGFLVPRSATAQVRTIVREGLRRMVLVSGPPLCGKSSVLRELADTAHQDGWDVLFLDGSSCSEGVFRRIANVLATQFSWPATPDEARSWLRQVASQPDRRLVLCIDSLPALRANLTSELDELATGAMGACLHVVLAVDEGELEQLTLKANRREKTRLGRNSSQVEVGHYDDEEFNCWDITEELEVLSAQGTHHRTPDVVCFVNGLPLVVIEAKRPESTHAGKSMVAEGISQHLRNQRPDEIPQLFGYAQLLMAVSQTEGRYGTTATAAKFWARWREEEFDAAHLAAVKNAPMPPEGRSRLFEGKPASLAAYFESLWSHC